MRGMINAYHTVYTMDMWNDKCLPYGLPRWSLGTTKMWVQIVILVCKLHICHSFLAIVFYINCFHLFFIILTIFKTCLRRNYLFSNLIYLSFVDIKICSASYERDIPKSSSVFSASCVAYACAFWNSSTAQRRRKLTAANSLPRTYKKKYLQVNASTVQSTFDMHFNTGSSRERKCLKWGGKYIRRIYIPKELFGLSNTEFDDLINGRLHQYTIHVRCRKI